jgi:hypothetical protein
MIRKLEEMNLDHETLFKRIHHVIIMTFLSIESQVNNAVDMHVPHKNKNLFQLFGFDILGKRKKKRKPERNQEKQITMYSFYEQSKAKNC